MAEHQKLTSSLGLAIRERRENLHPPISQEALARKADIAVRHVQKIEKGSTNPTIETLLQVAAALETNVQSLLDRAEQLQRTKQR